MHYKLRNATPGALPAGTSSGRGQGQEPGIGCLVKKDVKGEKKVLLRTKQTARAQVKPISPVKTCASKAGVAVACPLLGEQSPASPTACGVLMPLCKITVVAKDRRLKSEGAPLLHFFFFLSFLLFFWQAVCAWAVLAGQDGIGLPWYDSPSARVGLTDLAGVQRGALGVAGRRPAGFTGGSSLHPAKYVATGRGTKQPRTRRGCGAERNGLGAPREMGSNGMVSARKKCPVVLNWCDVPGKGKERSWPSVVCPFRRT